MSLAPVYARVYRVTDRLIAMIGDLSSRGRSITVVFNAPKSCTDGNKVLVGAIPEHCPEFLDVVPGFGIHEAAHIRSTNFEVLKASNLTPFEHKMQNVLEDYRIERDLFASFPGVAPYMDEVVRYMIKSGGFPNLNKLGKEDPFLVYGYVLYVLRGYLKQPEMKQMARSGRPALVAVFGSKVVNKLDSLIDPSAALRLRSTKDCIAQARLICALIKSALENPMPEEPKQEGENAPEGSKKAQGNAGESTEQGDEGSGETDPSKGGEESKDGGGESSEDGGGDEGAEGGSSKGKCAKDGGDETGESADSKEQTEAARAKMAESLNQDGGKVETDVGTKMADTLNKMSKAAQKDGSVCRVGGAGEFTIGCRSSTGRPLISRASRELAQLMKTKLWAQTHASEEVVRTGVRLRGSALYRIGLQDNRVFNRRAEGRGYDTDLVVLTDMSSSMSGHQAALAQEAACALASAVDPIQGVNCAVAIFSSNYKLIKGFGERYRQVEEFMAFGSQASGGTNTIQALRKVSKDLAVRKTPRKMIILLTDGDENPLGGADSIDAVMSDLKRMGVEVRTVGIRHSVGARYGSRCRIENASELPKVLFDYAAEALGVTLGKAA